MWDLSKYGNNIAIIEDNGDSVTYNELNIVANAVFEKINKRCLVFCLCKNSIGSIAGYVSFINNKIVPILLNANLEKKLLLNLFNIYFPSYIWLPESMVSEFKNVDVIYSYKEYCLLKTEYSSDYDMYSELCLLLTTSGSTGSSKLVRQSYTNVLSNALDIVEYLDIKADERPISTLPMNYTYGLSIINSHLLVGATLLVTEKTLMQKEFWNFFRKNNATSFGGVPYTYEMLDKLRFCKMDLPSLRYFTQAGGKLTPELHKKFAMNAMDNGTKFIVMYGQCEATARMGYLPTEKSIEKYGSMGIAIKSGKFKLLDAKGKEIQEPFVTGELMYEGPNVTLGYAETKEDLEKGDENRGILLTGDMAQFDEDGYFYIVGRKKRFLKIYGNRVNLDEIDRLVKTEFDNMEFVSAGVDDHLVLFTTNKNISDKIKDFVVKKTGLNPIAFKTVVIDSIPKNDSGKILYKDLTKYYD